MALGTNTELNRQKTVEQLYISKFQGKIFLLDTQFRFWVIDPTLQNK